MADAFAAEALTQRGQGSKPHAVSLEAILAIAEHQPDLNDAALIQCLLAGASKYASQGKAKEFKVALESAIKWCTPQSLKAIPEFNPGSVIRHRFEMVLPELRQTLTLLADLAGAGLYPVSAEALRNCVRLQYEYNMSLVYALLKPSGFDAFQRACSGQEMVWA